MQPLPLFCALFFCCLGLNPAFSYQAPATVTDTLHFHICEGDTIWVNGQAYHATKPNGVEIIPQGAANGADSIIVVDLIPVASPYFILNDTLCPDEFRIVNGVRYDRTNPYGLEILPNGSWMGCDSLVLVDLYFRQIWIYAGQDRTVVIGQEACVDAQFGLDLTDYFWTPAPPCAGAPCASFCQTEQQPTLLRYILQASDVNGCTLLDTVEITVIKDSKVFIPNVFNPSAQEPDNRFFVFADKSVRQIKRLWVADRWGSIVFEARHFSPNVFDAGWDGTTDGKRQQPGVYLYFAELERVDGSLFTLSGTVVMVQ